jgi:hypothetical protein
MVALRIACDGLTVGRLFLPPFQLHVGEYVCLRLPVEADFTKEKRLLVEYLTGARRASALSLFGVVQLVEPPVPRRGFLGLLRNPRMEAWLVRRGLSLEEARDIARRHGIPVHQRIGATGWNERTLVALEAALALPGDVLVFELAGNDPQGVERAHQIVASRMNGRAIVEVTHVLDDRWLCCPSPARFIALTQSADLQSTGGVR